MRESLENSREMQLMQNIQEPYPTQEQLSSASL